MRKKILFLTYSDSRSENIMMSSIKKSELIDIGYVFTYQKKINRIFRRITLGLGIFNTTSIWIKEWEKEIDKYEIVVIAASLYTPSILIYLRNKNKKVRLINYYWDKISISKYPVVYSDKFENWTFDKQDSEDYLLKYNPQFYSKYLYFPKSKIIYDVSFVGADREGKWPERTEIVNRCYNLFSELGLKCMFYYVSTSNNSNNTFSHKDRISEKEFYRITSESKAVLDIVQPGKEWITLRPLLSLSNKKKLITNNRKIADEQFYSKKNIFILDMDKICYLKEFIESPFDESMNSFIEKYEVDEWGKNFLKDNYG